ncbi:MAG: ATP-binding protein [Pseudomonadota bacterium]|nr:ATP-binding protein [Pseudomonadota bacterium]
MDRRRNWYVFRVFNLYRLVLVALLLGIFSLDERARLFGADDPGLFLGTALVYIAIVLVSIALSYRRRPPLQVQAHSQTFIDLIALGLLIHASGGGASNLSILLVTAIAAGGILLPLYSALAAAGVAFAIMAAEWFYRAWTTFSLFAPPQEPTADRLRRFFDTFALTSDDMVRLGVFGASFAIAALLTYTLAERVRRSEALVRQRTQELLDVAELNQAIVQHLQSGIIVVDRFARIRLLNDTARDLLSCHEPAQSLPLSDVSPVLSQRLAAWLSSGLNNPKPFRQDEHLPDVTPSFTHLSGNQAYDTLIFLEDSAQAAQRLQQIKLAALGRLTASIAHEIRNPLASISHAAQLLEESATATPGDRRLGHIIHDNAKRANRIIANVLDLSRRDKAKPEDFALKPWLENFGREFLRGQGEQTPQLEIRVLPEDLTIRFDPTHFYQVLWNLCTNACQHGAYPGQTPRIRLSASLDQVRGRPVLEVVDFGPGIPEAEAKKIFEPFFTTQARGTGLGLYISREMCEANRAQLQYLRPPVGGSCFRITFAKPAKQDKQWMLAMP